MIRWISFNTGAVRTRRRKTASSDSFFLAMFSNVPHAWAHVNPFAARARESSHALV